MRFDQGQHPFYGGIDRHARTMHVGLLDQAGQTVFDKGIPCRPEALLRAIQPYREHLVIGAECRCAWSWVADLGVEPNIPFVLGHALSRRAIHGGKAKNDRMDAGQIARRLKGGTFPLAYADPKGMRETRDRLRRRTYLVRQRAELLTPLQILNAQDNLAPFPKKLSCAANRVARNVAERFADPSVPKSAAIHLALIDRLDELIGDLAWYLVRTAKVDDVPTFDRLRSMPGVGKVLALILRYETHASGRFDTAGQFLSSARRGRCAHAAGGKQLGSGGQQLGQAHRRWAFAEAACRFLRSRERATKWQQRPAAPRGAGQALAILAARRGRAVSHRLRKGEAFEEERFGSGARRTQTDSASLSRKEAGAAGP